MSELIKEWTIQIAGVIIFSSICEMIIPSSSIKKYIHIVLGMILVLTIVSPLGSKFINEENELFGDFERYNAYKSHINMDEVQRQQVMELYNNKLSKNIEETVESISGVDDAKVKIETKTENIENFGEIEHIIINITDLNKNSREEIYQAIQDKYGVAKESIEIRG